MKAKPSVAANAVLYPVLCFIKIDVPVVFHETAYKKVYASWGVQSVQNQCDLYFYWLFAPSLILDGQANHVKSHCGDDDLSDECANQNYGHLNICYFIEAIHLTAFSRSLLFVCENLLNGHYLNYYYLSLIKIY